MVKNMNLFSANHDEKCPCDGCLMWIMCRQKRFKRFQFCEEICSYLGFESFDRAEEGPHNSEKHFRNYPIFFSTLKPLYWIYQPWPIYCSRRIIDYMIVQCQKD